MALQISYTSQQFDITVPTAYAKIEQFNGNATFVNFLVYIFASQQARLDNKREIGTFNFQVPYTDGMSISAIYTYMKTLSEFSGAIDV